MQTTESGARAARFGTENARRIASTIGAKLTSKNGSNAAEWNGKTVVLKNARLGNDYIGIPYSLLERVSGVVAALEESQDHFVVFELGADIFRRVQKRQSKREVGQVRRKVFLDYGREVGVFAL